MWDSILNACATLLYKLAVLLGDWGLAIILVTLVIRLLLFPLQRKQNRSNFAMQDLQPRLQEIQQKYEGDQQKISEETMKIYQEIGFNPMAGCLPMLIQMPVFIILFQILRNKLGDFVGGEIDVSFFNILPDLTITATKALSSQGFVYAIPYFIFFILFVLMSVAPMILQMLQNKQQDKSQTMMMLVIMAIMFVWMGWISPAGVLLYWSLSSCFGFVQSLLTQRHMKKEKKEREEAIPDKPIVVNVERREKKKRPKKKH